MSWQKEINLLKAGKLDKTGGTLTGPLILAADPATPLGAATQQYVDNRNLTLANGRPAYLVNGTKVSDAEWVYDFGLSTNTRNVYLNIAPADVSSNLMPYRMPYNGMIRAVTIDINGSVGSSVTFQVRINGSTTATYNYVLPSTVSVLSFTNESNLVNVGDTLAVYMAATNNVGAPALKMAIAWRD